VNLTVRTADSSLARPSQQLKAIALVGALLAGCAGQNAGSAGVPSPATGESPQPSEATFAPSPTPSAALPAKSLIPSPAESDVPIGVDQLAGRIAFAFDDGIWVSDADGRHRRRLTHDGGFDPTFSPDGGQIAYRLLLAADDGEIWVMDANGGNMRDLVNDPKFSDWGPAWSPDGRLIAYDSNRRVGLAIWLMTADGSGQRIITHGHGEYPSWSPDGKRIAYAGGGYYDIHVTDADGSNDRALTTTAAYDMGPAWSPDGAWIAYHTQADYYPDLGEAGMGPEMEIHVVRPDGSDDHRITFDRVEDSFPAWSPDGRFLMWSRHGELVVARSDGSGVVDIGPGNFPTWIR
jgi:Tol biopolymer transport system component